MSNINTNRLVLDNLPQVFNMARHIHHRLPPHVPLSDLVSAATLALVEASHRFSPERMDRFKGYAEPRVRGAILDCLRGADWASRGLRGKGRRLKATAARLRNSLGREPTDAELAEAEGMTLAELHGLQTDIHASRLESLNNVERYGADFDKHLPTGPQDDLFHLYQRSEHAGRLAQDIKELPEREQRVLSLYYWEELTQKEIGKELGLTEGRVSQIRSAAVAHLREVIGTARRDCEEVT